MRDPLVELINLGPTLLEMAELGSLAGAGFSLGPLLHGKEAVLHDNRVFRVWPAHHGANQGVEIGFPYGELYHLE